ncbi:hypothetical protein GCM10011352_29180 [Marinobacterium zhoushanense]|uniref:Uncharacterized protein n=1 Tax=Marinobacterium zhoushanense TaxID=1679163 RepID=A0ABQ1KIB1_9GAMM|nr:hypothetical protein GCM10011352_29180 [Marinobacterium zhoushanense]
MSLGIVPPTPDDNRLNPTLIERCKQRLLANPILRLQLGKIEFVSLLASQITYDQSAHYTSLIIDNEIIAILTKHRL